jgi:tetratricopeptide (TPR) repeat protein
MKLPVTISKISLDRDWQHTSPYPPLGFVPFSEVQLGNGDSFGLYWPIGREAMEPIVVETWHDEGRVQPHFSCLGAFLDARASSDGGYVETPSLVNDPNSPRACYEAAKLLLNKPDPAAAMALLEMAIEILPEYADALSLLYPLYALAGRTEDAIKMAIRSIISPPSLGGPAGDAVHWLRSQSMSFSRQDDPIWCARYELDLVFGGAKDNTNYPILLTAIDNYLHHSEFVPACTLMQTYAELMSFETVSFQQRYSFDKTAFIAKQIELSSCLAGGRRTIQHTVD